MTLDEEILNTTIRIETKISDQIKGSGTGFFFNFCTDSQNKTCIPAIVTNKHVVKNAISGELVFNILGNDGKPLIGEHIVSKIDNFESQWIMHPNSDIDLCVLPIGKLLNTLKMQGTNVFFKGLSRDLIISETDYSSISDIEDVIFVGYPDWIYDKVNNKPIVRKGLTATSVKYNFEGKPLFLIDASVYGGSSGSPVYLYSNGLFQNGENSLSLGRRFKFLGIISSTYKHFIGNEIKVEKIETSTYKLSDDSFIPNHLGVVIKANQLLVFDDLLKLIYKH